MNIIIKKQKRQNNTSTVAVTIEKIGKNTYHYSLNEFVVRFSRYQICMENRKTFSLERDGKKFQKVYSEFWFDTDFLLSETVELGSLFSFLELNTASWLSSFQIYLYRGYPLCSKYSIWIDHIVILFFTKKNYDLMYTCSDFTTSEPIHV